MGRRLHQPAICAGRHLHRDLGRGWRIQTSCFRSRSFLQSRKRSRCLWRIQRDRNFAERARPSNKHHHSQRGFERRQYQVYNSENSYHVVVGSGTDNTAVLGGITNFGNLSLINTTFYSNKAYLGGGVVNTGTLTIYNSTFSHNSALVEGGGINNAGTLNLSNTILTNATYGGDCYNTGGGSDAVNTNSLIENNSAGPYHCGTPLLTDDPNLDLPADNGGPTQTMALQPGSPAIDAGDDTVCSDPGTVNNLDQRGITRLQRDHCDMGAFKFEPLTFNDIPTDHWAWQYIESLYNAGITGGCGSGNYCPDNSVTRAQMAIFLLRAKYGSVYAPPAATGTMFDDVPASLSTAAWIEQLANEGITSGCNGGNYCPNNPVTRAANGGLPRANLQSAVKFACTRPRLDRGGGVSFVRQKSQWL